MKIFIGIILLIILLATICTPIYLWIVKDIYDEEINFKKILKIFVSYLLGGIIIFLIGGACFLIFTKYFN